MKSFSLALCFLAIPLATGCASFSATMLHRGECNTGWEKERHLRGVPTHIRVDVIEKHYLVLDSDGKTVSRKSADFPIREVIYTPIETEKIFLVDLKRPGAGTINATIDLNADEQYFNQIETKVVDTTIDAVGDLLAQIAPGGLIGAPTAEGGEPKGDDPFKDRIKEVSSVVASEIFEIDSPSLERDMQDFLARHLNCCHTCSMLPTDAALPETPKLASLLMEPSPIPPGAVEVRRQTQGVDFSMFGPR